MFIRDVYSNYISKGINLRIDLTNEIVKIINIE